MTGWFAAGRTFLRECRSVLRLHQRTGISFFFDTDPLVVEAAGDGVVSLDLLAFEDVQAGVKCILMPVTETVDVDTMKKMDVEMFPRLKKAMDVGVAAPPTMGKEARPTMLDRLADVGISRVAPKTEMVDDAEMEDRKVVVVVVES